MPVATLADLSVI